MADHLCMGSDVNVVHACKQISALQVGWAVING